MTQLAPAHHEQLAADIDNLPDGPVVLLFVGLTRWPAAVQAFAWRMWACLQGRGVTLRENGIDYIPPESAAVFNRA